MKHVLSLALLLLASCANTSKCNLPPGVDSLPKSHDDPPALQWPADSKVMLPYIKELPKHGKPKAVVMLITGLDGVTGDYNSITRDLTARGYAVYGYENRSTVYGPPEERGSPRAWKPWVDDLLSFDRKVRGEQPGLPVFWHAHSFGAVTALAALARPGVQPPKGLILHSPGYALMQPSNVLGRGLGSAFGWARLPHISMMDRAGKMIAEDPLWDCRWKHSDDRVRKGITVRFISLARKMGKDALAEARQLPAPTLAIWGGKDGIARGLSSWDEYDAFMDKTLCGPALTKQRFEKGGHLLTEGVTQEAALAEIGGWLARQ